MLIPDAKKLLEQQAIGLDTKRSLCVFFVFSFLFAFIHSAVVFPLSFLPDERKAPSVFLPNSSRTGEEASREKAEG